MREQAKQILDYALAKEAAAEAFFRHWGERCDVGDVKQLLNDLADEELRHIEKLSSISPEALIAEGRAPVEIGFLQDLHEEHDEREMTVLDVLSVAIEREEKAIALYKRMGAASTTEGGLFAALVVTFPPESGPKIMSRPTGTRVGDPKGLELEKPDAIS